MKALPEVSIVIPLYNEAPNFPTLIRELDRVMGLADFPLEVVLIDDGSLDGTSEMIQELALRNSRYQGVILSRNHGHQSALTAGLKYARGTKAIFVMDGDMQDPPEMLFTFYRKLKEGYDVIYAIREKRKENILKKMAYWMYYRVQRSLSNIQIPLDAGDFGMMSRRVVDQMNAMPEESRYLRGMRSWVGFKQIGIPYNRQERSAGKSNYTFRKLMSLAFNGIFNFSEAPIKFISKLGVTSILIAVIYLGVTLYHKIFIGDVPIGFTALIAAIVLFSGVQLLSIGILGEYIIRIFFQVKNRPLFIVERHICDGNDQ